MSGYKTFKNESFGEFTVKRSRFICYGKRVESINEAQDYINSIKTKHWDAEHNVFAYCLKDGNVERFSDDNEPQGTAGIQVLNVLNFSKLKDVVVVITRYFGGVLLGKGGLSRAYSQGAYKAVEVCGVVTMEKCLIIRAKTNYENYGKLENIVINSGAVVLDYIYKDFVEICFSVRDDKVSFIKTLINAILCGKVNIIIDGEKFCWVERKIFN